MLYSSWKNSALAGSPVKFCYLDAVVAISSPEFATAVDEFRLEMVRLSTGKNWLLWSVEHKAWWRADEKGYCWSVENAGRYTLDEATAICELQGSNKARTNPDTVVQPSPEYLATRQAIIAVAKLDEDAAAKRTEELLAKLTTENLGPKRTPE